MKNLLNILKGKKGILFNTSWLFFDKIIRMGGGLLVGVWVARYLGPEKFGYWSYATAIISILSIIVKLGLDSIVIRDIIKHPENTKKILGTSLVLRMGIGVIIFIIACIVLYFFEEDELNQKMVFIILFSLFFYPFDVVDLFFQSQLKSKFTVIAKNASFIVFSLVKVGFIIYNAPLPAFALAFSMDIFFGAILLSLLYTQTRETIFNLSFNKRIAIGLLKDGWPMLISGISVLIFMRIDQLMISKMAGKIALGNYSSAIRISEAYYFIPMAIVGSFFPSIINAKKQSRSLYLNKIQQLNDLMTWISIFAAIVVTIFADHIMLFLYGEAYVNAGTILAIHIWASIFAFIGVSSHRYLLVENLTHITMYKTLVGVFVNIILNYILIPSYGAEGAAYATLITQAIYVSFANLLFKKSHIVFNIQLKSFNIPRIIHDIKTLINK